MTNLEVIDNLTNRLITLGATQSALAIRTDLRNGAGYALRTIMDKHNRYAYDEGDAPNRGFTVDSIVRSSAGEFVARLGIEGTDLKFMLRYTEDQ